MESSGDIDFIFVNFLKQLLNYKMLKMLKFHQTLTSESMHIAVLGNTPNGKCVCFVYLSFVYDETL